MASVGAWIWPGEHPEYKPDMDRSLVRVSGGNYRQLVRSYNATRDNWVGQQDSFPGGAEISQKFLGKYGGAGGDGREIMTFLLARENDGRYFSWYDPAVNPTPDPSETVTLGRHFVVVKSWAWSNRRLKLLDFYVVFVEVPHETLA